MVSSILATSSGEAVRTALLYPGYHHYQPYQQYYQPHHDYRGYFGYNYSPYYSLPYTAQTMMAYRTAPATAPVTAPAAAPYTVGSQFHAQDEFGNLNYGYSNINSAKQEVGNTYGGVQGGNVYI